MGSASRRLGLHPSLAVCWLSDLGHVIYLFKLGFV